MPATKTSSAETGSSSTRMRVRRLSAIWSMRCAAPGAGNWRVAVEKLAPEVYRIEDLRRIRAPRYSASMPAEGAAGPRGLAECSLWG